MKEMIVKEKTVVPDECKWFTSRQAMECYSIKEVGTLIKYRKQGAIIGKRLGTGQWLYPKAQFVFKPDKK